MTHDEENAIVLFNAILERIPRRRLVCLQEEKSYDEAERLLKLACADVVNEWDRKRTYTFRDISIAIDGALHRLWWYRGFHRKEWMGWRDRHVLGIR